MRIFLIGFMGCGKSTIGKKLAEALSCKFIDLDKYIEGKTGESIQQIFKEKEEKYFRVLETESLMEICKSDNLVIATGGGTPCFFDNMQRILDKGICIYLKMEANNLAKRLSKERSKRPLIKNLTKKYLVNFIRKKLVEREVFYNKANHIIQGKNISEKDIIKLIS
ncbi:MAG TPA: shikimate kinase [Flavobacteriales bacterium]|nr:shikimate kinase [Flavobacteriales bacterium]|tara:strand:- start:11744 stop:12241 length:498 start_codon:yes stop_codon:yes gene_type:complete